MTDPPSLSDDANELTGAPMTSDRFVTMPARLRRALLAGALALAPVSAAAQVQPFVAGGLAIPAGAVRAPAPALPYGNAGLGMQVDAGIALGLARGAVDVRLFGTYAAMGRDYDGFNADMERNGIDLQLDGSVRVVGGGAAVVYYFPVQIASNVYPYVLGLAGVYRQRVTQEWSGDDVLPGTEDEVDTSTRLGGGAGAGLIWDTGRLRLFVESRFQALLDFDGREGYLVPVQVGLKLGPP